MHRLRLDRGHVILRLPNVFLVDTADSSDDEGMEGVEGGASAVAGTDGDATVAPAVVSYTSKDLCSNKAERKSKQLKQQRQDISLDPFAEVELDISYSAYANARKMFQVTYEFWCTWASYYRTSF